jgi:hypothetical protein
MYEAQSCCSLTGQHIIIYSILQSQRREKVSKSKHAVVVVVLLDLLVLELWRELSLVVEVCHRQ